MFYTEAYLGCFMMCALGWEIWFIHSMEAGDDVLYHPIEHGVLNHTVPGRFFYINLMF